MKFPQSQSLEIAAGRLAASLERYEDAARLLEQAQNRDTPNSVIAYYLGIAEEGLGYAREAETSYEIAYRQADLRGAAAIRLGELRAREGNLQGAASVSYTHLAGADHFPTARARAQSGAGQGGEEQQGYKAKRLT